MLSILPPDSELTITGTYRYYDDNGIKQELEFFKQDIHTLLIAGHFKPIPASGVSSSTLHPLAVQFDNVKIQNPSAYVEGDLSFENMKNNSLNFLYQMEIVTTNRAAGRKTVIPISNTVLKRLKRQRRSADHRRAVESDQTYDYQVIFRDRYGNVLPTEPQTLEGVVKPAVSARIRSFR